MPPLFGWLLAFVCLLGLPRCVYGEPPLSLESTTNTCSKNADCEQGTCVASVCSAASTDFGALLFEVIPPPANARFLGARYYMGVEESDANDDVGLTIAPPLTVSGEISISLGEASCRPSPVEVTFVPVETYWGIETVRYSAVSRVGTTIVDKRHVDTHTYQISGIPAGKYDVFLRDAALVDNSATPACEVVPDVERGVRLTAGPGITRVALNISQRPARSLEVIVSSLAWEGWRVDVVHAKSNELLSSRGWLAPSEDRAGDQVRTLLRLATTEPDTNQMLLRLQPPSDLVAPTISMVLAGLEVFEVGQALVPRIEPFDQPVTYQTWVWRSVSGGGPVPGKVHFTALELANVPAGVTATFDVWAEINEQGLVTQTLPPGRYRVDVRPQPGSGYSSASSEVTVWVPTQDLPGDVQGGHVLQVNRAVNLSGTIEALGQSPPLGTQVRLVGIDAWPRQSAPLGMRRRSTLPVSVSDLVVDYLYELESVDCGNCAPEQRPRLYNMEVLPTEQSGFPRVLTPGVEVHGFLLLERLKLELPKVLTGNVVVNERSGSEQRPRGYPGVLVRAYALLSASGEPFSYAVPTCGDEQATPVCAASVIEIASTYTGIGGAFHLLLPQGFTPLPSPLGPDGG